MTIIHLMKDYRPTVNGAMVRNTSMLETFKLLYPDTNIIVVNLEGNLYQSYEVINGIEVFRVNSLYKMIKKTQSLILKFNADVIQGHNYRFLLAAYLACKLSRKKNKLVAEIHALYNMSFWKEGVTKFILRNIDAAIVLAECAKKKLSELYGIPEAKIYVIRNGLESAAYHSGGISMESELLRAIENIKKKNGIVLGYTGSFYDWQGVGFLADHLCEVLDINDKLFVVMIGNGPEFNSVKARYENLAKKERIIIHAGVSKQEMNEIEKLIDVVLIPREKNLSTNTAVPLKAIEAMRNGKCILCGNDDGLREVLSDKNSIMFKALDTEDFLEKIKLIVNHPELIEEKGLQAQLDARRFFSTWEENCEIIHSIYCE